MPPNQNADALLEPGEGQSLLASFRPVALAMLNGDKKQARGAMERKLYEFWVPTGLFWTICENHVQSPHVDEGMRWLEARRAVYLCQLHSWDDSVDTMAHMFQLCKVGEAWFVRIIPDV